MTPAERQACLAALKAAEGAAEALRSVLADEARESKGGELTAEAWPEHADDPDLIDPSIAAMRAGTVASTVRRWAHAYGIGRQYGSRWRISSRRLSEHLSALRS